MTSPAEHYLREVLPVIVDRARNAKAELLAAKHRGDADGARFEAGRCTGYYQVLSTLVNQLDVFGLDYTKLGLPTGLDLDKELL